MKRIVERTYRVVGRGELEHSTHQKPKTLESFRDYEVYVLLGPPGAGKTSSFRAEADAVNGLYVSARDFLVFRNSPEWTGKTLFIDGLDEVRCGAIDKHVPFDSMRKSLNELGRPRFRLSCREADWIGLNDERHLKQVSNDGQIEVLRIDPLSLKDVKEILSEDHGHIDVNDFIGQAKKIGLEHLLFNPQSLELLLTVVSKKNVWPKSRTEAFDVACEVLAWELNEEHANSLRPVAIPELIDAAGRLCAIHLLTGKSGYSRQFVAREDLIPIDRIVGENPTACEQVLGSKLFEQASYSAIAPIHRHIAEFLAAKHLARLVVDGLPIGRILSLMQYNDGEIVPQLRGLAAWLAVLCPSSRNEIISRDPVGSVLYGDVREFSLRDKRRILDGVQHKVSEDRHILRMVADDSRMGDLLTKDASHLFGESISMLSPDDEQHQYFASCLIACLKQGSVQEDIHPHLWRLIRNRNWHESIRVRTLEALLSSSLGDTRINEQFEDLLQDIQIGRVEDAEDELKGTVLDHLYGTSIFLPQAAIFITEPRNPNFRGTYQNFWLNLDLGDVPRVQIEVTLDRILERLQRYRKPDARLALIAGLLGKVFFRFLAILVGRSTTSDAQRLIELLKVAADLNVPSSEASNKLKKSLVERPDLIKAIVNRFVQSSLGHRHFDHRMHQLDRLLLDFRYRDSLGAWFLDQAISTDNERAANWFVRQMASLVHSRQDHKKSLKTEVENRLNGRPALHQVFADRILELETIEQSWTRDKIEQRESKRFRQENWSRFIEERKLVLMQNRLPGEILNQLALVYFGEVADIYGDTPRERLRDLIGDNENLIKSVLFAFRKAIFRDDVPDQVAVIEHRRQGRVHNLALPILAGLQEVSKTEDLSDVIGDEHRTRSSLAIYYTNRMPQGAEDPPNWVANAAQSDPRVFADVLIEAIRLRLEEGENCRGITHDLATISTYAEVACLATLPLLRTFPVRCKNRQLATLAELLGAAARFSDQGEFQALIRLKLTRKGMNVGQRINWLGAGLLWDSDEHFESFLSYIPSNDRRIGHLVRFLAEQGTSTKGIPSLSHRTALMLVRVIGSKYMPVEIDFGTVWTTESAQASRCVFSLIDQLAQDPSLDVTQCLCDLRDCQDLASWREHLKDAVNRRKAIRRECDFEYSDVKSVISLLKNEKPATVVDLKAIVVDALQQIRRNLRDGDSTGFRKYWNVDSHSRVTDPKPEIACRDTFKDDLRSYLNPVDVAIHSEVLYFDDKKSDLTAISDGFKLPLELKLSHSPDLWTAIEDQLIPKYMRDPASKGHGIYVVFWFGDAENRRPTPRNGVRPSCAQDLENQLQATLDDHWRSRVAICVIDVSEPTQSIFDISSLPL